MAENRWFIILSITFFFSVEVSGLSGGFYADNGRQQSILYEPLQQETKEELEEEILHLLGLDHRPKPRNHDTFSSAPRYLLNIYKTLERDDAVLHENLAVATRKRNHGALRYSDFIISFVNKVEVQDFESLKELMLTEQIKRRVPLEIKEHYLDNWEEFKTASLLAEKYDKYEALRRDTRELEQKAGLKIPFEKDRERYVSSNVHHQYPHLRHERHRRFWFSMTETTLQDEKMVWAELRIYKNLTENHLHVRNIEYTLSLYAVSEINANEEKLDFVDEIVISSEDAGWLIFNVTGPVLEWIEFPKRNLGLELEISSSIHNLEPHDLGILCSTEAEEFQPFMLAYFKTQPERVHVRTKRALSKKQRKTKNLNPYTGVHQEKRDSNKNNRDCQRWALYVSFKDLGWKDWIIAPDGYGAFYCEGRCRFPMNSQMNATNHAILQALVHLTNPAKAPKPCCAPSQLSPVSVIYFDDNSNVVLKKYKNMVVKSCGCY
ncbi:bone morphogenetic protein 7-like [Stegodyphus dumicola]|uniref:bone morphogenetic protein 7-like n=1 Tax=Stegodyphus dumicola TaxID=202533 RepID=UPI0015AE0704|nr:bone morphogenetic protein 7-like [Stegodyphus dumicola]